MSAGEATVQKIRDALSAGTIRAIGGTVYDVQMRYLCSTSDLAAVRHLIPFERIDAGGSPTWQLKTNTVDADYASTPHWTKHYER